MKTMDETSSPHYSNEKLSIDPQMDFPPLETEIKSKDSLVLDEKRGLSRTRGIFVIVTLAGINFLNTMGSGILIAALPRIAKDLDLADGLILW